MAKQTLWAVLLAAVCLQGETRITLIAGPPSHGPLAHEQNAAVLLLEKWLNGVGGVKATAYRNGWPEDAAAIGRADAIFVFCDGAEKHLVFQPGREEALQKAVSRGAGLMLYHFAVEPPAERGHQRMLDWTGGLFELNYSVNPVWEAAITPASGHPATRGVGAFQIRDEWYYNLRFSPGITALLTAVPPPITRPDGPRSGNADVRAKAGQSQVLAWAIERRDGGRGAGFTGGHFHLNLGDPNFRKFVLNTILWTAKVDVPANGVEVAVTQAELMQNLDPKPARRPK